MKGDVEYDEDEEWEWTLKITRVANGYVIEGDNDNGVKMKVVIEERENPDDDEDEYLGADGRAGMNLLWHVIDYFSLYGSRYDQRRIHVTTREGDKYMAPKEGE